MVNLVKAAAPIAGVVIAGACVVALVLAGRALFSGATAERGAVGTTTPDPLPPAEIPPIDAAAPAGTKTATFALG